MIKDFPSVEVRVSKRVLTLLITQGSLACYHAVYLIVITLKLFRNVTLFHLKKIQNEIL